MGMVSGMEEGYWNWSYRLVLRAGGVCDSKHLRPACLTS